MSTFAIFIFLLPCIFEFRYISGYNPYFLRKEKASGRSVPVKENEFPFIIGVYANLVRQDSTPKCLGIIINPITILTSASCAHDQWDNVKDRPQSLLVKYGIREGCDLYQSYKPRLVRNIIIHSLFEAATRRADLAFLITYESVIENNATQVEALESVGKHTTSFVDLDMRHLKEGNDDSSGITNNGDDNTPRNGIANDFPRRRNVLGDTDSGSLAPGDVGPTSISDSRSSSPDPTDNYYVAYEKIPLGTKCIFFGWFTKNSGGNVVQCMTYSTVEIEEPLFCLEAYAETSTRLHSDKYCAGMPAKGDVPTLNDTGGPLICGHQIVGLCSLTTESGTQPGVFTPFHTYKKFVHAAYKFAYRTNSLPVRERNTNACVECKLNYETVFAWVLICYTLMFYGI